MRSRHVFVQRRFRVESLFALGALKALAAIPHFVTLQMALQLTSIRLIKLPYLYHQVDRDKNELRHFAKFSSLTSPVVLVAAYFALEFSFFVTFDRRFGRIRIRRRAGDHRISEIHIAVRIISVVKFNIRVVQVDTIVFILDNHHIRGFPLGRILN